MDNLNSNPPKDNRQVIKIGLTILIVGFGGFLIWGAFAPLDEGIPSMGNIAVESKRKTIQHLSGGLVEKILVKDGDYVEEGQTLMILDTSKSKNEFIMLENQAKALEYQLKALKSIEPEKKYRLKNLENQTTALEPVVTDELYPKNKLLDMQRDVANLRSDLFETQGSIQRLEAQIVEKKANINILKTDLERSVIKAPVHGNVVGLSVFTIGGVISPGTKIMDIVPDNDILVVEATVAPHLVHYVRKDLTAQLRFTALDPKKSPVAFGRVTYVSPDLVTDPKGNNFFSARIEVPSDKITSLNLSQLHPGMPVDVVIITGERSLLNYVFKPLVDRFAKGLKEK